MDWNKAIERFLDTGDSDPLGGKDHPAGMLEGLNAYNAALRNALLAEVRRRTRSRRSKRLPDGLDSVTHVRRKLEPMVQGLLPKAEQETVLDLLQNSITFLTREATYRCIRELPFLHQTWNVANIFLESLDLPALSGERSFTVGMAEGERCFVSMTYFKEENRFSDYVVHEAAHMSHYTKREMIGLSYTKGREWLLEIDIGKRETFAYACEIYSCIRERCKSLSDRSELMRTYQSKACFPADERVEQTELLEILHEAVAVRNGWKRILKKCERVRRRGREGSLGLLKVDRKKS